MRVYPRVCGGALPLVILTGAMMGLSPRVRGSHPRDLIDFCLAIRVYPRVCGGASELDAGIIRLYGSIPACAGEPVAG